MKETLASEGFTKLGEMIEGIRYAMLATVAEDGSIRSRPMTTQKGPLDGVLTFFVGSRGSLVEEIRADQNVNLAYADTEKQRYVSVSGRARVVRDRTRLERLWDPSLVAWFPLGLDDPELALLDVAIDRAEYWDVPTGALVTLVGLAKALATGETSPRAAHETLVVAHEGE